MIPDLNEEALRGADRVCVAWAAGDLSVRGTHRADTTRRVPLTHGDVVVWGGAARLRYHGVLPLKGGQHPLVADIAST